MRTIFLAIFAFTLTGCATTYHGKSFTGGFSETRLDENIFTVRFAGNAYTDPERATDFCLLRCAELALQHGYAYFIVIESSYYEKHSTYTTPTTADTTVNADTLGTATTYGNQTTYMSTTSGHATTVVYGGQTYVLSKPRSANTIVCLKEKPNDGAFVFNAAFIQDSLKSKYGLQK